MNKRINTYLWLKTKEEFDKMYPASDTLHYSHKTGGTTAWPENRLDLLGTLIEVSVHYGVVKYQSDPVRYLTIQPEMIDHYINKEENPEYFL